jgi:hypothetical protein
LELAQLVSEPPAQVGRTQPQQAWLVQPNEPVQLFEAPQEQHDVVQ